MHKAWYPRDNIDRIYASKKERRGHASIEGDVDASIQRLEDYIKKSKERTMTPAINSTDNISSNRTRNRSWKKNNCMDISSDKRAKFHTRRPGKGEKREPLREKLNLF